MIGNAEIHTLDLGDGTRCRARINFSGIENIPTEELVNLITMDCEGGPWDQARFDRYAFWIADLWQRIADRANRAFSGQLFWLGEAFAVYCHPGSRPKLSTSLQMSLW